MSTDQRLDRIESRLAALEAIVRDLARAAVPLDKRKPAWREEALRTERDAESPESGPIGRPAEPPPPGLRASHARAGQTRASQAPAGHVADAEQWIGQRGLLAVGVLLVILATAYLLKVAFDRNWISPAVRCAGGAAAGVAVAALGWRLYHRPLRTYGAALIGTGAGIVYLATWAAGSLYTLIPGWTGIAVLVLTSLLLAAAALRLNVEALGAAAALGAFVAPLVIETPTRSANVLLGYLAAVGATLGTVCAIRRWRGAMAIVALMYFGLGLSAARDADPWLTLAFAIAGGSAGLAVALRAQWIETRFASFAASWALVAISADALEPHWPVVAGALILAAPIWWRALNTRRIWPDSWAGKPEPVSLAETFYFFVTPLFVMATLPDLAPQWFGLNAGAPAFFVALPYLVLGLSGPRVAFATAGSTGLLIATLAQWQNLTTVWVLLALAAGWVLLSAAQNRADYRWYSLGALTLGVVHLISRELERRPPGPGFADRWALTLWLAIAVLIWFARRQWQPSASTDEPNGDAQIAAFWHHAPVGFWSIAGLLVFAGVTNELDRAVRHLALARETTRLASGLAVSAWWAVFAGSLVLVGFLRALKPVRVAGLCVAGLAIAKVLLVDLSRLDALFRVGSTLTLGVVSLLVAYQYYRRAGREPTAGE